MKKPIYKKWWFIVIVVILGLGIIGALLEDETEMNTGNEIAPKQNLFPDQTVVILHVEDVKNGEIVTHPEALDVSSM